MPKTAGRADARLREEDINLKICRNQEGDHGQGLEEMDGGQGAAEMVSQG